MKKSIHHYSLFALPSGNDIIDEERRRLNDLKQKAVAEVHSQWEEKRAKENGSKAMNSESEDSSITSSEAPSEKDTR